MYILGPLLLDRLRGLACLAFQNVSLLSNLFDGDLMAHATNDINALTCLVGGGVMSRVPLSVSDFVDYVLAFMADDFLLPFPLLSYHTTN